MKRKITAYYNKCDSVSRFLTGLHMLEKDGRIDLSLKENIDNFRNMPGEQHIVELEMEDGSIFAFDFGDRWALHSSDGLNYLDHVEAYFARDYSIKKDIVTPYTFENNAKVKPFGFNYYCTYKQNPLDSTKSMKHRLKKSLENLSGYSKCFSPEYFEGKANKKEKDFTIVFLARLWDAKSLINNNSEVEPDEYTQYLIKEWNSINEQRIEIIRKLKERYGKAFIGGVCRDSLSEKMCPELIVPRSRVRKKAYIDCMKKADICIGTMGLHRSIGWKMGEYIAAARAIVAERLEYVVPGNFEDGNHYIPFNSVSECLNAVDVLMSDAELIYKMKVANQNYYSNFLKPDIQILNAFKEIGIQI